MKKGFVIFAVSALAAEAVLGVTLAHINITPPKTAKTNVVSYHRSFNAAPWVETVDDGSIIHASSEDKMIEAVGDSFTDEINDLSSREIQIMTNEEIESEAENGVTVITLTEEETDTPYRVFSGSFDVDMIEETQLPFLAPPTTFGCVVGYNKAIIIADGSHENNFKKSTVTVTYADGTIKTGERSGTGKFIPVIAESGSGGVSKAVYTLTMYSGDSESSEILEQAVITLTLAQ